MAAKVITLSAVPQVPLGKSPVYFCSPSEVSILDEPRPDANVVGKLAAGALVRIVAEHYETNAFFVRIDPVNEKQATYYEKFPLPLAQKWICAAQDHNHFAFWSNVEATSLSPRKFLVDLDDRFVALPPDV